MDFEKISITNFNKYLKDFNLRIKHLNEFNRLIYTIETYLKYEVKDIKSVIEISNDTPNEIINLYELIFEKKNYILEYDKLKKELNDDLFLLIKFSNQNNVFFNRCSDLVYANSFESRFKNYQENYFSNSLNDFFSFELENKNCFEELDYLSVLSDKNKKILKKFSENKKEFWQKINPIKKEKNNKELFDEKLSDKSVNDIAQKYEPNISLERYPLNGKTIKWFGIDYDNLSNEELHAELDKLKKKYEDIFIDFDNEFIYTGIFSVYDDDTFFSMLKELEIPFLHDVKENLKFIENERVRNNLYSIAMSQVLEAQYQARNKIVEKLMNRKLIVTELSDTSTTEKTNNFDPNNFNNSCYNLFCYLVENYKKKGKIKFINIYYFLKDEVSKDKYSFYFIQDDYNQFIKSNYDIEIKKFQKAMFDFDEQKRVLNALEEQFRKQ
jgi:hypothetical protein